MFIKSVTLKRSWSLTLAVTIAASLTLLGCETDPSSAPQKSVPRDDRWGLYSLNLVSQDVHLIYSANEQINTSALRLNSQGDRLLFAQKFGSSDSSFEICSIDVNGANFTRLTNNAYWDIYPAWSPDDNYIAFLSWRQTTLDIYVMGSDGSGQHLLYDSGTHDGDVDWAGSVIAFTSDSRIWKMNSLGSGVIQLTDPPNAGQWGNANLPFGDYDPRSSEDGAKIVFERLEDDLSPNGNYNLFTINTDGTEETRLTDNGYSQGLASWSHSGFNIVYAVAAINDQGVYDLYMMNADGTDNHSITPDYFPSEFLCHAAEFSLDDSQIYFIGEWYQ